jgi:serine/threonine protein kinase
MTTVSTKGDVYSFGVVLLELLPRRHPSEGEGREGGKCVHLVDWVCESFDKEPLSILENSLIDEDSVNKKNQMEKILLLM